jgi:aspartate/methionine/tyrosine aminotransferase
MPYPPFEYLGWVRAKQRAARFPLTLSGMSPPPREMLSFAPDDDPLADAEPALFAALSRVFGPPPEAIALANGTTGAVFAALAAILSPGDLAVVEEPTYELLRAAPAALGARVARLPRRFEDGFAVDPAALKRLLAERPKVIVIANPHNPSGRLIPEAEMARLIGEARDAGAEVLVDEVYLPFAPRERPAYFAGAVSVASPTKVAGLGGLRIGWVFARPELAERVRDAADFTGNYAPLPSARLLASALARWEDFAGRGIRAAAEGLPLVRAFVESQPRLSWHTPQAGLVGFVRLNGEQDAGPFIEAALSRHEVGLVPGRYFDDPSGFRLGFGGGAEAVSAGLTRLAEALQGWR